MDAFIGQRLEVSTGEMVQKSSNPLLLLAGEEIFTSTFNIWWFSLNLVKWLVKIENSICSRNLYSQATLKFIWSREQRLKLDTDEIAQKSSNPMLLILFVVILHNLFLVWHCFRILRCFEVTNLIWVQRLKLNAEEMGQKSSLTIISTPQLISVISQIRQKFH